MKKYLIVGLVTAMFIFPSFAKAATMEELQAQIAILLNQIAQLQQQISSQPATGSGGGVSVSTPIQANYCPKLIHNFYLGVKDDETGGQVTELQKFLAQDTSVYPEGLITGYFGPMTEQAVRKWQAKHGIVSSGSPDTTGYGVVGPKTREVMRARCSSVVSVGTQTLLPTVGQVQQNVDNLNQHITGIQEGLKTTPVMTVISPNGGEKWQQYSQHSIRWSPDRGDGTVDAYLDRLENGKFINIGKVIEVGKGSILWDGEINTWGNYAQPGSYYIRLFDRTTGAEDRSDAPFTIVPSGTVSADLKVIGSDGPLTLKSGRIADLAWTSSSSDSCIIGSHSGTVYKEYSDTATAGSINITIPNDQEQVTYILKCSSDIGHAIDRVDVNVNQTGEGEGAVYSINPVISHITPTSAKVGDTVTVYGSNFYNGDKIDISGPLISATVHSLDKITFSVPLMPPGNHPLFVIHGNTRNFSNGVLLNVTPSTIDTTPPTITTVTSSAITSDSALISWTTNELADTQVEYGLSTSYGTATNLNTTMVTSHSQTLANLQPSTLYHFRVRSQNTANTVISKDQTFTTLGSVDIIPPSSITITSPNGGEILMIGQKHHITWNSTGVDKVTLGYSSGIGTSYALANNFAINIPNTGYYDWNVSIGNAANSKVKLYIIAYSNGVRSVDDISDGFFTINPSDPVTQFVPVTGDCSISDIYGLQDIPNFVGYNLYMKVNNLSTAVGPVFPGQEFGISGADTWNGLKFKMVSTPSDGHSMGETVLKATQTINSTGLSYVLAREANIKLNQFGKDVCSHANQTVSGTVNLSVPVAIYPIDNATLASPPIIQWSKVEGGYNYQVDLTNTSNPSLYYTTGLVGLETNTDTNKLALKNGTYSWRVRVCDGNDTTANCSAWSTAHKFTISLTSPDLGQLSTTNQMANTLESVKSILLQFQKLLSQ